MLQQQLTRLLAVALLAGLSLPAQFPAKMNGPKSGGGTAPPPVDPGGGAPPVQSNTSGGSGGTTSNSQSFTTPVVLGNYLVVYIFNSTDLTSTVTTAGWVGGSGNCGSLSPTAATPVNGSTRRMYVYTAPITTGGCTGVVFNFSASINSVVIYAEYAGISGIDVEKVGTGTGTAITSGVIATTNQYDLLVGGLFVTSSGGGTLTAGAGYTIRTNNASTSHRTVEDQNVAALGSYAATATYSSAQTYIAHLLALKRGPPAVATASNYFLAPAADGGSDANTGLSAASPWLSPNHPLNCGDTITAKASTAYSATNFANNKWGTVTCATNDNVAWLKCETFNGCKIAAANVFAMWISRSYWGVQGWETSGTGNNGVCFGITPTGGATIHHIILANNVARGCANGFSASNQNSTASVDHISIVGNIAWNATQSTVLCNSGITIYDPVKADSAAGTHIYIAGNFTFDNLTAANCNGGTSTYDGNGIALDDIGNVQSGGTPYDQQILVENNISVWNGGYGLGNTGNGTTVAPITYRYNTSVGNLTAAVTSIATCGDMTLLDSLLTTLTRNLIVTKGPSGCAGGSATLYAVAVNGSNATTTVATNWLYSATGSNVNVLNSPAFVTGANTTNTNPLLTNPVDPGAPNCTGKTGVPDCMATLIANYTPANVSAKAYGYQAVTAPDTVSDPLFPAWLCKVGLPSGLITLHCPT